MIIVDSGFYTPKPEHLGKGKERRGENSKHPIPLSLAWPIEDKAVPVRTKAWPGHLSNQELNHMSRVEPKYFLQHRTACLLLSRARAVLGPITVLESPCMTQ